MIVAQIIPANCAAGKGQGTGRGYSSTTDCGRDLKGGAEIYMFNVLTML